MTDSMSKNLKIENDMAEQLGTNYKPALLSCKNYLVEAFDRAKFDALLRAEKKLKFLDKLESITAFHTGETGS